MRELQDSAMVGGGTFSLFEVCLELDLPVMRYSAASRLGSLKNFPPVSV